MLIKSGAHFGSCRRRRQRKIELLSGRAQKFRFIAIKTANDYLAELKLLQSRSRALAKTFFFFLIVLTYAFYTYTFPSTTHVMGNKILSKFFNFKVGVGPRRHLKRKKLRS